MGWAYGINEAGREVGYGVKATCDEPGCEGKIDRGIAYVCGAMHDGGEYGCGNYYCHRHLYGAGLCGRCKNNNACPSCNGTGLGLSLKDGECDVCGGMGERELSW